MVCAILVVARGRAPVGFQIKLSCRIRVPCQSARVAMACPISSLSTILATAAFAFQPLHIWRVNVGSDLPSFQFTSSGRMPRSNSLRKSASKAFLAASTPLSSSNPSTLTKPSSRKRAICSDEISKASS